MTALPLTLPDDLVPYAPSRVRTLPLYNSTVELAWLPGRSKRARHDRDRPPAFAPSPAERILEQESYWRSETLALTPNKYPFGSDQRILWMAQPAREPDHTFWRAALDWARRSDGTALLNNIGAAATIPRAHAHLLGERLPLLEQLPERALSSSPVHLPRGCSLVAKDVEVCVIGLRGPVDACAEALMRLAEARLTATWNVVVTAEATWIVPRVLQTPTPHFESAVGAAEFWGRFCYVDRAACDRATAHDLVEAWRLTAATPLA